MVGGATSQVVTLISYADPRHGQPAAVLGFIVNLEWTRAHYFAEIARQLANIEGDDDDLRLTLIDEHGVPVLGETAAAADSPVTATRTLSVAFYDPVDRDRPAGGSRAAHLDGGGARGYATARYRPPSAERAGRCWCRPRWRPC